MPQKPSPVLAQDPINVNRFCDEIAFVLEGVDANLCSQEEIVQSLLIPLLPGWQIRRAVQEILLRERILLCSVVNCLEHVI